MMLWAKKEMLSHWWSSNGCSELTFRRAFPCRDGRQLASSALYPEDFPSSLRDHQLCQFGAGSGATVSIIKNHQ